MIMMPDMKQESRSLSNPMSRTKKMNGNPSMIIVLLATIVLLGVGGMLLILSSNSSAASFPARTARSSSLGVVRADHKKMERTHNMRKQNNKPPPTVQVALATNTHLLLRTTFQEGSATIRIALRRDLAPESVQYVEQLVALNKEKKCEQCNLYRSEKDLLLQGVMADPQIPKNSVLGNCPVENYKATSECPSHDKSCDCHGPMMTRGMVGWAGGGGGPDFFLVTYKKPVDFWDHWHTVWGEMDEESIQLVEQIYELPTNNKQGMTMLKNKIEFTMELHQSS